MHREVTPAVAAKLRQLARLLLEEAKLEAALEDIQSCPS